MRSFRPSWLMFLLVLFSMAAVMMPSAKASSTETINIPDSGWRLWPDTAAAWQNDDLYLPGDVPLSQIPVNPPTGGWAALTKSQGKAVTLPSTVEQHYWGKFGFRPYTEQDATSYNVANPEVSNGNYKGVSWWWTSLPVPSSFAGRTVILHIRAARQRAEVYLNQKLVGYSMIEGTSFDCDVSKAMIPGQANQLAIRITNPGGKMDWNDLTEIHWGKYVYCGSRGFGGLDRGITLTAHDTLYLSDAWTLNTAQPKVIEAHATLHNSSAYTSAGWSVKFSILDPQTNAILAVKSVPAAADAQSDQTLQASIACPSAKLWNLKTPALYRMRAELIGPSKSIHDTRDVLFGFRWFAPDGVGTNAVLRLNGERIRLYSAISWGFWGLNGYFPTPALAEKEVVQAKRLGLNCLNFHRNLGHPEVLDAQDRLGLLRYMEPGGGRFAMVNDKPSDSELATSFGEKYMEDKVLGMIRDERSHPSLVIYNIQNETSLDLKSPRVFYFMRLLHQADPSRTLVLKSGIPPGGEAWMQPYDDTVYYDHGDGYCGWWDEHTADDPDAVWQDSYYRSPDDFKYRSNNTREIVDWGEAAGAGTLDDNALMVKQIQQAGGESYDLRDHQEELAAYHAFLDKWGFRTAFPTDSSLFHAIGAKQYDFWSNLAENVRLSDATDFLTISGWETTSIDNHSGLLDNMRNFHSDPDTMRDRLAPLLPVAKPHRMVLRVGESEVFDLTLLNETNQPAKGKLHLFLKDPKGQIIPIGVYPGPAWQKDCFVYPLKAAITTPPLTVEGIYHVTFALDGKSAAQQDREIRVIGTRTLLGLHVGVIGSDTLIQEINALKGATAETYHSDANYDVIAYSSGNLDDSVLSRVRSGVPMLVDTTNDGIANLIATRLAQAGAFHYAGMVGRSYAAWMGSWYFVRAHPVYDGLPVNEAMASDYQVAIGPSNGLMVDGPGVQVIVGYSRDHSRKIGAGTFTAPLGKGTILFQSMPQMNPPIRERWLANALAYLAVKK